MTGRSGGSIDVLYIDDSDRGSTVASGLERTDERLAVTLADVERGRDALGSKTPDCLAIACRSLNGPSRSLVEAAMSHTTQLPLVVFTDGTAGIVDTLLTAGVTDCVAAGGTDGVSVLAHRIRTAAEHSNTLADLKETEARFEALTENTNFAVVTINESSVVQYASEPVADLFGYEPAELIGEPLTAIMPERFHGPHHEAIDRYLTTGDRSLNWGWLELPGQHRDGTEFPLGVSFGERDTDDGRLFTAIIRDISEQHEREEQLNEMATALEQSIDGVALIDANDRLEYVNDAHVDVYGYDDTDELVGENWRVLYDSAEIERFETDVMPTVADTGQWRGEATGRRANGASFPQEVSLTQLDDGGFVCVVRDISDRVERRQELQSERQFVETIIDTLPDVFYVLDPDGNLVRWNDQMEAVTGYTTEELESMHALELIPPEDQGLIAESVQSVLERDEIKTPRSALVTKQGDRIPHEFSGQRLTDSNGDTIGLVGIGRDITAEQLREQRLTVLSRVLRHNVRNRISVVLGQAAYIAESTDDETLVECAELVESAAEALTETSERARRVETLLRDTPTRQRVDLVDCIDRGLDAAAVPTDAVALDRSDSAPVVATETVAVAVTELVENAFEHVAEPTVEVRIEREGDEIGVIVADDGPGLPEHERAVLADGTETPLKHSTGLGLWLVNWIVTAAGGHTAVQEHESGTTIAVLFSAAESTSG
jgi:PAS domain S-box-containing protein